MKTKRTPHPFSLGRLKRETNAFTISTGKLHDLGDSSSSYSSDAETSEWRDPAWVEDELEELDRREWEEKKKKVAKMKKEGSHDTLHRYSHSGDSNPLPRPSPLDDGQMILQNPPAPHPHVDIASSFIDEDDVSELLSNPSARTSSSNLESLHTASDAPVDSLDAAVDTSTSSAPSHRVPAKVRARSGSVPTLVVTPRKGSGRRIDAPGDQPMGLTVTRTRSGSAGNELDVNDGDGIDGFSSSRKAGSAGTPTRPRGVSCTSTEIARRRKRSSPTIPDQPQMDSKIRRHRSSKQSGAPRRFPFGRKKKDKQSPEEPTSPLELPSSALLSSAGSGNGMLSVMDEGVYVWTRRDNSNAKKKKKGSSRNSAATKGSSGKMKRRKQNKWSRRRSVELREGATGEHKNMDGNADQCDTPGGAGDAGGGAGGRHSRPSSPSVPKRTKTPSGVVSRKQRRKAKASRLRKGGKTKPQQSSAPNLRTSSSSSPSAAVVSSATFSASNNNLDHRGTLGHSAEPSHQASKRGKPEDKHRMGVDGGKVNSAGDLLSTPAFGVATYHSKHRGVQPSQSLPISKNSLSGQESKMAYSSGHALEALVKEVLLGDNDDEEEEEDGDGDHGGNDGNDAVGEPISKDNYAYDSFIDGVIHGSGVGVAASVMASVADGVTSGGNDGDECTKKHRDGADGHKRSNAERATAVSSTTSQSTSPSVSSIMIHRPSSTPDGASKPSASMIHRPSSARRRGRSGSDVVWEELEKLLPREAPSAPQRARNTPSSPLSRRVRTVHKDQKLEGNASNASNPPAAVQRTSQSAPFKRMDKQSAPNSSVKSGEQRGGVRGQRGGVRGQRGGVRGQRGGVRGQRGGVRGQRGGVRGQRGGVRGQRGGVRGQRGKRGNGVSHGNGIAILKRDGSSTILSEKKRQLAESRLRKELEDAKRTTTDSPSSEVTDVEEELKRLEAAFLEGKPGVAESRISATLEAVLSGIQQEQEAYAHVRTAFSHNSGDDLSRAGNGEMKHAAGKVDDARERRVMEDRPHADHPVNKEGSTGGVEKGNACTDPSVGTMQHTNSPPQEATGKDAKASATPRATTISRPPPRAALDASSGDAALPVEVKNLRTRLRTFVCQLMADDNAVPFAFTHREKEERTVARVLSQADLYEPAGRKRSMDGASGGGGEESMGERPQSLRQVLQEVDAGTYTTFEAFEQDVRHILESVSQRDPTDLYCRQCGRAVEARLQAFIGAVPSGLVTACRKLSVGSGSGSGREVSKGTGGEDHRSGPPSVDEAPHEGDNTDESPQDAELMSWVEFLHTKGRMDDQVTWKEFLRSEGKPDLMSWREFLREEGRPDLLSWQEFLRGVGRHPNSGATADGSGAGGAGSVGPEAGTGAGAGAGGGLPRRNHPSRRSKGFAALRLLSPRSRIRGSRGEHSADEDSDALSDLEESSVAQETLSGGGGGGEGPSKEEKKRHKEHEKRKDAGEKKSKHSTKKKARQQRSQSVTTKEKLDTHKKHRKGKPSPLDGVVKSPVHASSDKDLGTAQDKMDVRHTREKKMRAASHCGSAPTITSTRVSSGGGGGDARGPSTRTTKTEKKRSGKKTSHKKTHHHPAKKSPSSPATSTTTKSPRSVVRGEAKKELHQKQRKPKRGVESGKAAVGRPAEHLSREDSANLKEEIRARRKDIQQERETLLAEIARLKAMAEKAT